MSQGIKTSLKNFFTVKTTFLKDSGVWRVPNFSGFFEGGEYQNELTGFLTRLSYVK